MSSGTTFVRKYITGWLVALLKRPSVFVLLERMTEHLTSPSVFWAFLFFGHQYVFCGHHMWLQLANFDKTTKQCYHVLVSDLKCAGYNRCKALISTQWRAWASQSPTSSRFSPRPFPCPLSLTSLLLARSRAVIQGHRILPLCTTYLRLLLSLYCRATYR